jgi:hypothetical protein
MSKPKSKSSLTGLSDLGMREIVVEGALFVCVFNLAVVSLYLAFEITLIPGAPFSSPLSKRRATISAVQIQMCWLAAIMIPVILQWSLFRIWWIALLSGAILIASTWFVARWSLRELVEEMFENASDEVGLQPVVQGNRAG